MGLGGGAERSVTTGAHDCRQNCLHPTPTFPLRDSLCMRTAQSITCTFSALSVPHAKSTNRSCRSSVCGTSPSQISIVACLAQCVADTYTLLRRRALQFCFPAERKKSHCIVFVCVHDMRSDSIGLVSFTTRACHPMDLSDFVYTLIVYLLAAARAHYLCMIS